ncbi:MAG: nucleotidyltransferase domain-containing protein [Candidatus Parcubacteria bacterium]|nr:nucleotidyltransferase domain-containing protein [Candidatus Parcubacteria bacterium]
MKKLNRNEAIALLRRFLKVNTGILKWYRLVKPHIKAIVFYGSTAKGLNKSGSDLDLLIFVPLEIEKKFTKGEYVYTFYGRKIDIVVKYCTKLMRK